MIEVRKLTQIEEFRDAVELQRAIWGWDELDLLPVRFFVVASKIGGQVFGAFDRAYMAGFLLAIPGVSSNQAVYLHSHMLGILPEWRDSGAGLALKMAQKNDALGRGITHIEWSFDPLETKNAYFNVEKLGVVVRRYARNMYGATTSSLQAGLPTDRCIAEWDLTRTRVPAANAATRVTIPSDMARIKRFDAGRAQEIQQEIARQFEQHFSAGLAVTGFERGEETSSYLFTTWPSK
jgi:predicted GNAT superfamily acetyltransferase